MFGTLIESRAGRQRRSGGAMMSILLHGAIITGAVLATTRASIAKPTPPQVAEVIYHVAPPAPPAPNVGASAPSTTKQIYVPNTKIVVIPPVKVPPSLPPITSGPVIDDPSTLFITRGMTTHDSALAARSGSVADPTTIFQENDVERIAVLRNDVRPSYPEALRLAGVGGRVVVRFVVDTLGRVEHESVVVRESSHARFENAVRDVLPRMRFTPAQIAGKAVRMMVEMPFEFAITR